MVVSETEISDTDATAVLIPGYITVLPVTSPVRVLLFLKDSIEFKLIARHMSPDFPSIWVRLVGINIVVGAIYRQFSHKGERGLACQREQIKTLLDQVEELAAAGNLVILGDFNLDHSRASDKNYDRKQVLQDWQEGLATSSLTYHPTTDTWHSYGTFGEDNRASAIDHVYTSNELANDVSVSVLPDAITDHLPVLALLSTHSVRKPSTQPLEVITRRDFKNPDYATVNDFYIKTGVAQFPFPAGIDIDHAMEDFYNLVKTGLDITIPTKSFKVRRDTAPLYLSEATKKLQRARDAARKAGSISQYKSLRNRVYVIDPGTQRLCTVHG